MSVSSVFGSMTGFGDQGQNNPFNTNSGAYSSLYNQALQGINNVGSSPGMKSLTDNIQGAAGQMAGNLANNSAGQQANFLQQMGQNNANQQQSIVRSQGGTGGLANATLAAGKGAGAEAQATSQGLNSLYNTAVNNLGQLSGVQNQQFGQELNQANSAAGLNMGQEKLQLGIDQQNNANNYQAQQNQNQAQSGFLGNIAGGISNLFSEGGKVKDFHEYAKSRIKKFSSGGEADADADVAIDGPGWADRKQFVPPLNPSQKAKIPGNSLKNDKIPAYLSQDEVILPRSVTKSPDAPQKAAHFMEDVQAKDGHSSDFHSFAKNKLQHFDLGGAPDLSDYEQSQMSPNATAQGSAGSMGNMFDSGQDPGTLQGGDSSPSNFGKYAKAALNAFGDVANSSAQRANDFSRSRGYISHNGFSKGGKVKKRSA